MKRDLRILWKIKILNKEMEKINSIVCAPSDSKSSNTSTFIYTNHYSRKILEGCIREKIKNFRQSEKLRLSKINCKESYFLDAPNPPPSCYAPVLKLKKIYSI